MILAPATMAAEKEAKEAARKCLEEIGLDAESYRIGHTKARENAPEIPPLYRDFFWIDFELFPLTITSNCWNVNFTTIPKFS